MTDIIKVGELEFPPRKVWFKTFGCQMNYHDSERMLAILGDFNYTETDSCEDADLIIFNTCAIRALANKKFYSQLGEVKELKARKPKTIIGAIGCVAQIEGEHLLKKYKQLDFCLGTDVLDHIGEVIYRLFSGEERIFLNSWDQKDNYSLKTRIAHEDDPRAYVNIIKGCNNFCTYCIVPYTRGREISRTIDEIVADVKDLVQNKGMSEITLLGQNVNSFGKEHGETIAELIMRLDDLEGLRLLRYTSSHPFNVSDELIRVHGISKKLAPHLHLPVQSGSDAVLKRMHRKHTVAHYMELLRKLREAKPDIVMSTDIIVGFPNETEEEYQETCEFLKQCHFDFIYAYKYSPRPGTKAAKIEDHLSEEEKAKRLVDLQNLQLEIQAEDRKKLVGQTLRGIVEELREKHGEKKWVVRTDCMRIVHFKPLNDENLKYHIVDLKITEASALSCQGELVADLGRI